MIKQDLKKDPVEDSLGIWGLNSGDGLLVCKTSKFQKPYELGLVSIPDSTPLIVREALDKNYVTAISPAGNLIMVYDLDIKLGRVKVLNRTRSIKE